MNDEQTITISKNKYDQLVKDSYKLKCLESGGVDNWEWYSESLKPFFKKYYPDEYDEEED